MKPEDDVILTTTDEVRTKLGERGPRPVEHIGIVHDCVMRGEGETMQDAMDRLFAQMKARAYAVGADSVLRVRVTHDPILPCATGTAVRHV